MEPDLLVSKAFGPCALWSRGPEDWELLGAESVTTFGLGALNSVHKTLE